MIRTIILKKSKNIAVGTILSVPFAVLFLAFLVAPVIAGDYAALKGVNGVNTVFDVSQKSPKAANLVFWAVSDVFQNESGRALPNPPRTVVVFHGPAVKLISSDRKGLKPDEVA